jgi:hypothetical protein
MTGLILAGIGLAIWVVLAMIVMPRYGIKSVKGGG